MKPAIFSLKNIHKAGVTSRLLFPLIFLCVGKLLSSCAGEKAVENFEARSVSVPGMHVPEGFVIERATAPGMVAYPMFAVFDDQGRLFVIESSGKTTSTVDVLKNPTFKVLLLEDVDGDGVFDKRNVFADKIPYPMGGTFYRGSFYVTAPPDLVRFTDTDADGVADKREVILSGWTLNHNAATLSGPFFGPDGWMYMCDARRGFDITTKEGTRLSGKGARIWRCRPDGTGLESVSGGGFDNTIELIFMPSGETVGTMTYFTDPQDGFRDALMHWVEGGVYPKPYSVIAEDALKLTGPLMPVMTTLARVSPSGLMRYRSKTFGPVFKGNLFSAQFNTGRIMRHTITPHGATFRTQEEIFLRSDSLDTHPTDVLEDADGSLLVVNTGGWFIAGCPLSVVAKEDVHGGIFRIRQENSPPVEDPWGRRIDFRNMSAEELTGMMEDPRWAVRDNAIEQLVRSGEDAVAPLKKILSSLDDDAVRTAAVFALYRIQTPDAMDGVISALDDESAIVRTAAARVTGLAKERRAVDKLMIVLQKESPHVRRQAATALGQIGDDRAVSALLAAAAAGGDRFVEHAITYSVITLGKTAPVLHALQHPDENVRTTALIALDQMDRSPLKKRDVMPFLTSNSTRLQETGTWVLSHHPEWSDLVIAYTQNRFEGKSLREGEEKVLADLLVTFSKDGAVRKFVAEKLNALETTESIRHLLLDVVRRYPTPELPGVWVSQLATLLKHADMSMRSHVLNLIQSRSIPALEKELDQIVLNTEHTKAFQLKALAARIRSRPQLSDAEFKMLLGDIGAGQEAPVRQSAVRILVEAELNDDRLLALAKEGVPHADIFLLPGLVKAFEGNKSGEVGQALITALPITSDRLDYLSVQDLERLFNSFPPVVKVSARPLMQSLETRAATRLSALEEFENSLSSGDVGEGRKLFFGKALCSTCHSVVGQGGDFGPDLTNIGEIRSKHDLLEAILYPGASFAREYETTKVVTEKGTFTGIIKEQLPETLVVETSPGVLARIARNEITSIENQDVSLMPPGLQKLLTTQEMSDLMAYLASLPDGMGLRRF